MTTPEHLNLFLLVLNSDFAIVTVFLLVSALIYITWLAREQKMTWRDWLTDMPLGITVALALFTEGFGQLIVRMTTWVWRISGGHQPLQGDQLIAISVGSAIGLIGLLLLIRSISKPGFGEKMWLAAFGLAAMNTVVTLYLFLPD